jgi:hypothetical protein
MVANPLAQPVAVTLPRPNAALMSSFSAASTNSRTLSVSFEAVA